MVNRLKCVTVAMRWRLGHSRVVASRTQVWLVESQWSTDIVCACAGVVPAGSAKAGVAGWSRRCTGAPLARLVALTSYTGPKAVMFEPNAGGAASGATPTARLPLLAVGTPTATLPSDEVALPFAPKEDAPVAFMVAPSPIDWLPPPHRPSS